MSNTKDADHFRLYGSLDALRNQIHWFILGLFCASLALPINGSGFRGVFGVWLAYESLLEGMATFVGHNLFGRSPVDEGGLFAGLILIYLALPNLLFVIGFVLFLRRSYLSYIFFSLSLSAVAYWVAIDVYSISRLENSGAYIWVLSFVLMFIFASKEYAYAKKISYVRLFVSPVSLFIYVPAVVLFFGYIAFNA